MLERIKQYNKIRMFLAVIVLFFVSLAMSCQELRYSISGKTTDAAVVRDQIETQKRDDGEILSQKRAVFYTFTDNEKVRQEYAEVPMDWERPEGKTVKIQYIAGRQDQSRLLGQHHYVWMGIFFASLVAAVIGFIVLAREE